MKKIIHPFSPIEQFVPYTDLIKIVACYLGKYHFFYGFMDKTYSKHV